MHWLRTTLVLAAIVALPDWALAETERRDNDIHAQEPGLAESAERHLKATFGLYEKAKVVRYVRAVAERLGSRQPNPTKIALSVLDSGRPIALSLTPGQVYLDRGLLPYLDSEAELAAVIALELSRRETTPLDTNSFIPLSFDRGFAEIQETLGALLGSTVYERSRATRAPPRTSTGAAQAVDQALRSRHAAPALHIVKDAAFKLARAGYSMAALRTVIDRLRALAPGDTSRSPTRGHSAGDVPPNEPTVRAIAAGHAQATSTLKATENRIAATVNREDYLASIEGIPLGPPASEGVVRAGRFYHAELGVSLACPSGYTLDNRSDRLLCTHENGGGVQINAFRRSDGEQLDHLLARALGQRDVPLSAWRYDAPIPEVRTAVAYSNYTVEFIALELPQHALVLFDVEKPDQRQPGISRALEAVSGSVHLLAPGDHNAVPPTLQLVRADGTSTLSAIAKKAGVDTDAVLAFNALRYPGNPSAGALVKIAK